ncbi:hypothetical protein Fmac_015944 [Flemingia macrophylla]|uniref:DUF7733 domain-containing protein n=1 Tax=Flemingia macrophylla TaxID=520843 RepID=A0ABD1MG22_9FABA
MSGGVGPTACDIALPKDQELDFKEQQDQPLKTSTNDHNLKNNDPSSTAPQQQQQLQLGFLSFNQLNSLAVVVVLSASGMVSPEDFAFVFFSFIYMHIISKVAFPSLHPSRDPPNAFNPQNRFLQLYVLIGATIGLFTPIAYILEGVFEGDKEGIKAAAPHVFLLASEVFMEGVASSQKFSAPVRAFMPAFYNARRIFTIVDWLRSEVHKVNSENGGSGWRVYVGRGLAIANMAFWCFNLFGFLLPVYLPKVLKAYYSGTKDKIQ